MLLWHCYNSEPLTRSNCDRNPSVRMRSSWWLTKPNSQWWCQENSIEFSLDYAQLLILQYIVCICKDCLVWYLTVPLDVWVNKKNLLKFLFIRFIYLYTILLVYALCNILSHAKNRKEKKIEKEINIDLAVVASQWFRVATYNSTQTSRIVYK